VGLRPTAVVRLERALAHSWAPGLLAGAWGTGCRSCVARQGAWVWMAVVSGRGTLPVRARRSGRRRTRPVHGTGARPGGSNQGARTGPEPSGTAHRPTSGAHAPAADDRHADGRRKTCPPGCGQPLAGLPPASLVSRGSPGSSPPVVRGISPNQGRGTGHTGATDVHRLWTTVWTVHPGALGEPCLRSPLPTQDGAAGPWPDHCSTMPTAGRPRPAADETTRGAHRASGRDSA
jgi:hypothetical protein